MSRLEAAARGRLPPRSSGTKVLALALPEGGAGDRPDDELGPAAWGLPTGPPVAAEGTTLSLLGSTLTLYCQVNSSVGGPPSL